MDNKITKKRLLFHLRYEWYKYFVFVLISVLLSIFLFDWIATTKAWERIDIYIVCNEFYDNELQSDVQKFLDENIENNMIREVQVTKISPSESNYRELYTVNGGSSSTILILPYSEMALTGHQVLSMTDTDKKNQNKDLSLFDTTESFVSEFLLKDTAIKNYYFNEDGSGKMENLFIFNKSRYPEKYTGEYFDSIEGNLYGFKLTNLARCPFKWYQYEEDVNEIKYKKDESGEFVLENGEKVPLQEDGYLVVNTHAAAYTVGKHGSKQKYYDHNETFIVASFIMDRYFYNK